MQLSRKRRLRQETVISTALRSLLRAAQYFRRLARLIDASQVTKTAADGTASIMYDSIMPTLLKDLPDLLMGIPIVLVMSASMSTLSSLVLTSSSTFTLDFLKGAVFKEMKENTQLLFLRIPLWFSSCCQSSLLSTRRLLSPSSWVFPGVLLAGLSSLRLCMASI